MAREQDYITLVRQYNKEAWDAFHALKALQSEWNALDYSNTLDDGEGSNTGYIKAEVGSVVFDTTDAFFTMLGTGHATNMAKLL